MQAIPYLCDRLHREADRLRTLYHIIYSGADAGRTFPKLFPIGDKNLHPLPRVGIRGCIPHKRYIIRRIHRSLCPWAIRLHDDSSSWIKLKKSICKRPLVCMRMTIGMGVKPLFVSYANHYSFVHRTTIGLSANDYCTEPYPNSFTPPLTK